MRFGGGDVHAGASSHARGDDAGAKAQNKIDLYCLKSPHAILHVHDIVCLNLPKYDCICPKYAYIGPRAAALADMTPAERAAALAALSPADRAAALAAMTPEQRAAALANMSPEDRTAAVAAMTPEQRAIVLAEMGAKERAAHLEACLSP